MQHFRELPTEYSRDFWLCNLTVLFPGTNICLTQQNLLQKSNNQSKLLFHVTFNQYLKHLISFYLLFNFFFSKQNLNALVLFGKSMEIFGWTINKSIFIQLEIILSDIEHNFQLKNHELGGNERRIDKIFRNINLTLSK